MDVSVQVGGGFPLAFRIAEQLYRRSALDRIVTSYPHYFFRRIRPEQIPRSRFKSVPVDLVKKPLNRSPFSRYIDLNWQFKSIFDAVASHRIGSPDLLVGWPSTSLRGLRRANRVGCTTVVATDNVNITPAIRTDTAFEELTIPNEPDDYVFQRREIDKELERFGIQGGVSERYVLKSLREYVEADYLVVPTQYVYDALVAIGFAESKIAKVPFGVDTKLFRPRKRDCNTDTFKLLFVGGIRYRKGVQYLLEAVNDLNDLDLELTIIGGKEADVETFEENTESFEYVGHVDHKNLPDCYAKADAFVFPSILEGFGSVVLEAMASGLPVITTEHTGGVEVIEDGKNGFLVPVRDVEALKKKIRYLYDHRDEATAIGRAARETAEAHTWDDFGRLTYETYVEFAAEQSQGP